MGGLMILVSMTMSILLWMDLSNGFIWACLFVTLGFGAIGFMDDYDKVREAVGEGRVGARPAARSSSPSPAARCGTSGTRTGHTLYLPFLKDAGLYLGLGYIVFAAFTIVGLRQCGEPDRRARRAGDDAGDHRRAGVQASSSISPATSGSPTISASTTCRARASSRCSSAR